MNPTSPACVDREVHLAEYRELKQEQRDRIQFRDRQIYVTLTAAAAVTFFAFGGGSPRYAALLLLPPVCMVMGWASVQNDQKVSEIGRYIRVDLTAALGGGLRWETAHRSGDRRRRQKIVQLIVDFIVFCLPGYLAVAAYLVAAPSLPALAIAAACVGTGSLSFLACEIVFTHRSEERGTLKRR